MALEEFESELDNIAEVFLIPIIIHFLYVMSVCNFKGFYQLEIILTEPPFFNMEKICFDAGITLLGVKVTQIFGRRNAEKIVVSVSIAEREEGVNLEGSNERDVSREVKYGFLSLLCVNCGELLRFRIKV